MSRNSKATPAKLQMIRDNTLTVEKAEAVSGLNPLAALFRKLIWATGAADQSIWKHLMYKYLSDARNSIPRNKKDQATAKGNLQKEILKDELTFNVLVKGLRFLDFRKVTIILQGTKRDGEVLQVQHTMNLGDRIHLPINDAEEAETPNE